MNDLRANNEQPSEPDPLRLNAENRYPLTAAVSITALAVTSLLDGMTRLEVPRGVYASLAALFLAGFVGSLVRSAQRLLRAEIQRLRAEVAELRREMRNARPPIAQWAPPWGQAAVGRYPSHANLDTVPLLPKGDSASAETSRAAAIEEGFELGYRARDAEGKAIPLPARKPDRRPRLTRDS